MTDLARQRIKQILVRFEEKRQRGDEYASLDYEEFLALCDMALRSHAAPTVPLSDEEQAVLHKALLKSSRIVSPPAAAGWVSVPDPSLDIDSSHNLFWWKAGKLYARKWDGTWWALELSLPPLPSPPGEK